MNKIILCDTVHHATPILMEWYYGLEDLGYQVSYLPIPEYTILNIDEEFDILIYAGIPDSDEFLKQFEQFKLKFPKCKIIGAGDSWKPNYINFKGIVDFFITTQHECPSLTKSYEENGFKLYNVPLAANHRLFFKVDTPKLYDACFIGNLSHGYRGEDKFLYPILDNDRYNCILGGIAYKKYQTGFIPYQEHNSIRNATRVNLNFHVPYQKPNKGEHRDRVDLNQSVYNIALSGNFQLCDHPLVETLFKGSIVIGDESNWLELFNYYLHNKEEREAKAEQARQIAIQSHTWLVRMTELMQLIRLHYLD
jgi:hypothetical protein